MRGKLRVEIGNEAWIQVREYFSVDFDEEGFRLRGKDGSLIKWIDVIRVADGYRIHPYAIEDWDFWAIQTEDPSFTIWVYPEQNPEFNKEILRRFGEPNCRPMASWADSELDIRACVFWPPGERRQPLYRTVKRHSWSLRSGLTYFREDQAPSGATGTMGLPNMPSSGPRHGTIR